MTILRWIRAKKIQFIQLPGGQYRIPDSEVERLSTPVPATNARTYASRPRLLPQGLTVPQVVQTDKKREALRKLAEPLTRDTQRNYIKDQIQRSKTYLDKTKWERALLTMENAWVAEDKARKTKPNNTGLPADQKIYENPEGN